MRVLSIDVSDFDISKKKIVQDAFFKMGYSWLGGRDYKYLNENVFSLWNQEGFLSVSYGSYVPDKTKEVTFNELIELAGMEDKIPRNCPKPDDKVNVELTLKEVLGLFCLVGETFPGFFNEGVGIYHKLGDLLENKNVSINGDVCDLSTNDPLNLYRSYSQQPSLNPYLDKVFEDLKPKEPEKELVEFNGKMYDKEKLELALKGLDEAGEK